MAVPVDPDNNPNNRCCHPLLLLLPENYVVQTGIFGQKKKTMKWCGCVWNVCAAGRGCATLLAIMDLEGLQVGTARWKKKGFCRSGPIQQLARQRQRLYATAGLHKDNPTVPAPCDSVQQGREANGNARSRTVAEQEAGTEARHQPQRKVGEEKRVSGSELI